MRCGVERTTPAGMAMNLAKPRMGQRLIRRAAEAAGGQLARLLLEYGGRPVPKSETADAEAAQLEGWYPIYESDGGWAMPGDLSMALWKLADRQRFFLATLIARLSERDVQLMLHEQGRVLLGSHDRQRRVLLSALADTAIVDTPEAQTGATNVEELGAIRSRDVDEVRYVDGSGGMLFVVVLSDGEEVQIVPREVAEALGREFEPPQLANQAPERSAHQERSVRLPDHQAIGALITFATARAAEEALRKPDFRSMVARRLDERRVATRPGHSAASALDVLSELGFVVDPTMRGDDASH
jgi:hypothetical protein